MAGTTLKNRIIALTGVIVFFISICALTAAVIIQLIQDNKQKELTASADQCQSQSVGDALAAPEGFKPEGDVTKLETRDLTQGSGPAAKKGDCLVMKYYGSLAKDGAKFDENYTTPTAFAFVLGGGQVIGGWEQGLAGMKAGGERRLIIPSELGYGPQGSGESIPPDADLVFQVKLLKIQK